MPKITKNTTIKNGMIMGRVTVLKTLFPICDKDMWEEIEDDDAAIREFVFGHLIDSGTIKIEY